MTSYRLKTVFTTLQALIKLLAQIFKNPVKKALGMKLTSFDLFLDAGSESPHVMTGKKAFLRSYGQKLFLSRDIHGHVRVRVEGFGYSVSVPYRTC